ncbi:MAG: hypothetical protein R2854_16550 [Caldilineaceae bacterium]
MLPNAVAGGTTTAGVAVGTGVAVAAGVGVAKTKGSVVGVKVGTTATASRATASRAAASADPSVTGSMPEAKNRRAKATPTTKKTAASVKPTAMTRGCCERFIDLQTDDGRAMFQRS